MTTKKKRRGSSKAGRPRKEGERFPSGGLKPPKPNAVVLSHRAALLGGGKVDLTKAENALDVALTRGWMEEQPHRDARRYAALYARAGVQLPRLRTANLQEGEGDESREARRSGVVETSTGLKPVRELDGDPEAHATLKLIWAHLTSDERKELLDVCILGSWPQWVVWRAAGKDVPQHWERKRQHLLSGLQVVGTILDPRMRRGASSRNETVEVA